MNIIKPDVIDTVVAEAIKAMSHSYGVGDTGIEYGAAVLTNRGNIFSSGIYRSSSRTLSLHAEHGALAHAAAHGETHIQAIAVVSNEKGPENKYAYPCGSCRQLLHESQLNSGIPMIVILATKTGEEALVTLDELYPLPWPSPMPRK